MVKTDGTRKSYAAAHKLNFDEYEGALIKRFKTKTVSCLLTVNTQLQEFILQSGLHLHTLCTVKRPGSASIKETIMLRIFHEVNYLCEQHFKYLCIVMLLQSWWQIGSGEMRRYQQPKSPLLLTVMCLSSSKSVLYVFKYLTVPGSRDVWNTLYHSIERQRCSEETHSTWWSRQRLYGGGRCDSVLMQE